MESYIFLCQQEIAPGGKIVIMQIYTRVMAAWKTTVRTQAGGELSNHRTNSRSFEMRAYT